MLGPYWCLYVTVFGSRLTGDGVTVIPKHVGAVLM